MPPGLLRKRAEVAARIAAARAEAEGLAKALDALDATIRLFAPGAEMPAVPAPWPVVAPRQRMAQHGEVPRAMLDALREAGAPLPTRQLASAVAEARGFDMADARAARCVRKRINSALRDMRDRGVVASEARGDGQTWWRIA